MGRAAKYVYDRHGPFAQFAAAVGLAAFLVRNLQYAVPTLVAVLLAVVVSGGLQYWFFRFRLDDDRILIRQGVLKRTATDLPYERIQGILVNRSLAERLLGLVTVALETPGSFGPEGELPAVAPEVAERLKARVAEHQGDASPPPMADEPTAAEPGSGPTLVQRLGFRDVLQLGIASPGVFLYVVMLLTLGRGIDDFARVMDDVAVRLGDALESMTGAAGGGALAAALVAAALVLGVLALILLGRVGAAMVRHHDYTLWDEGGSYRSQAGLVTRREVAVGTRKVQQLRLKQSLPFRAFRRYRLRAPTVGLTSDDEGVEDALGDLSAPTLEIPWADDSMVERIRSGLLRDEGRRLALLPGDAAFRRISPLYIRAVAIRLVLVGAPAGAAALFVLGWMVAQSWEEVRSEVLLLERFFSIWGYAAASWGALCLILAAPIGWLRWRAKAYMHDEDGLACRSGLIGRSVEACIFRKAQGVVVRRSPLQRRHGLATIEVETACGDITVPYIGHAEARRLRDHIAHRVESSTRRWY